MHKRVLLALILLFLAMTLSTVSFLLLENRFSTLGKALENAVYAQVPISSSCDEIQIAWKKCSRITQIFVPHSDLAELRTTVESLQDLSEDPATYRAACIQSLHLLEGVRDALRPTIENIL